MPRITGMAINSLFSVSYTHLDVYKRQDVATVILLEYIGLHIAADIYLCPFFQIIKDLTLVIYEAAYP